MNLPCPYNEFNGKVQIKYLIILFHALIDSNWQYIYGKSGNFKLVNVEENASQCRDRVSTDGSDPVNVEEHPARTRVAIAVQLALNLTSTAA